MKCHFPVFFKFKPVLMNLDMLESEVSEKLQVLKFLKKVSVTWELMLELLVMQVQKQRELIIMSQILVKVLKCLKALQMRLLKS